MHVAAHVKPFGSVGRGQRFRVDPRPGHYHHAQPGNQDLVHGPDGLEGVQVMLGRLALEMPGLAGQESRGGMDQL
jgi:hypothetical protein